MYNKELYRQQALMNQAMGAARELPLKEKIEHRLKKAQKEIQDCQDMLVLLEKNPDIERLISLLQDGEIY